MFQLWSHCKLPHPCVIWSWFKLGSKVSTVYIIPLSHKLPECSSTHKLIQRKRWWRNQSWTRSILDNLVLITSLVTPWWEAPAVPGKKGEMGFNWRGWLTRRCWQFLPHRNHSHHVCISSDSSPNITQIPTTWISGQTLNLWSFLKLHHKGVKRLDQFSDRDNTNSSDLTCANSAPRNGVKYEKEARHLSSHCILCYRYKLQCRKYTISRTVKPSWCLRAQRHQYLCQWKWLLPCCSLNLMTL